MVVLSRSRSAKDEGAVQKKRKQTVDNDSSDDSSSDSDFEPDGPRQSRQPLQLLQLPRRSSAASVATASGTTTVVPRRQRPRASSAASTFSPDPAITSSDPTADVACASDAIAAGANALLDRVVVRVPRRPRNGGRRNGRQRSSSVGSSSAEPTALLQSLSDAGALAVASQLFDAAWVGSTPACAAAAAQQQQQPQPMEMPEAACEPPPLDSAADGSESIGWLQGWRVNPLQGEESEDEEEVPRRCSSAVKRFRQQVAEKSPPSPDDGIVLICANQVTFSFTPFQVFDRT